MLTLTFFTDKRKGGDEAAGRDGVVCAELQKHYGTVAENSRRNAPATYNHLKHKNDNSRAFENYISHNAAVQNVPV